MYEQLQVLLTYIRMVWRFRWIALVGATTLCLTGWVGVLLLPNEYEVSTKVFVDTRTMLKPLLRGLAVDSNVGADASLVMRRMLVIRPNLEKVVRDTDMDLMATEPREYEQMLLGLAKSISIASTPKDNIFVISYRNSNPKLAARVVETILNLFVEHSIGESRRDSTQSREFFEQQIAEHERRLNNAEKRLKEFKQENIGRMPDDGLNYYARLEAVRRQLAAADLELSEAKNRVAELERQISGEEPSFGLGPAIETAAPLQPIITRYDERVHALENSLDELLLQFTEKHPDIISTRRLLDEVEAQREREVEEIKAQIAASRRTGGASAYNISENPVYQELKIALGEAQATVAGLETRASEYRRRANGLARLVDTIPEVEAELAKLNRDYDVVQKYYRELVTRYEALKLASQAGQSTDDVQFKVIEPPRVPIVPISPDRKKLSIAMFFLGLAGGVGLAILLAMLRPAIYRKESLRELANVPVLGVVSRLWTPRERLRRRMEVASFGVGCFCLFAIFAGLMTMYHFNFDAELVAKVSRLSQRFL